MYLEVHLDQTVNLPYPNDVGLLRYCLAKKP